MGWDFICMLVKIYRKLKSKKAGGPAGQVAHDAKQRSLGNVPAVWLNSKFQEAKSVKKSQSTLMREILPASGNDTYALVRPIL